MPAVGAAGPVDRARRRGLPRPRAPMPFSTRATWCGSTPASPTRVTRRTSDGRGSSADDPRPASSSQFGVADVVDAVRESASRGSPRSTCSGGHRRQRWQSSRGSPLLPRPRRRHRQRRDALHRHRSRREFDEALVLATGHGPGPRTGDLGRRCLAATGPRRSWPSPTMAGNPSAPIPTSPTRRRRELRNDHQRRPGPLDFAPAAQRAAWPASCRPWTTMAWTPAGPGPRLQRPLRRRLPPPVDLGIAVLRPGLRRDRGHPNRCTSSPTPTWACRPHIPHEQLYRPSWDPTS